MHHIPHALGCRAYLWVWQEEGAFYGERAPFLVLLPFTLSVWWVPVFKGGMGVHGWVVRCFQPSVQSPSWSWLQIVEALNVNLEMSRWCLSVWISLHFLKTRVWPLLWWGFSFRTSFCLFYMVAKSRKRLPHSHLALITQDI